MRLLLLPISTRRAFIYCEPLSQTVPTAKKTYAERAVAKANETWASWEKADSGWKLKTTQYANMMFRKIPFEEWGLKSIPPRKKDLLQTGESERVKQSIAAMNGVEVRFPRRYQELCCGKETVLQTLERLSVERLDLHKKRLVYSLVGLPLTLPFGLIPILPNLPFFYLAFRAWSHWRALNGSRHLQYLVSNQLIREAPSSKLDAMYTAGLLHDTREESQAAATPSAEQTELVVKLIRNQIGKGESVGQDASSSTASQSASVNSDIKTHGASSSGSSSSSKEEGWQGEEIMLLKKWNAKVIAEQLQLPALEIEIERAVEQVEQSLQKQNTDSSSGSSSGSSSSNSSEKKRTSIAPTFDTNSKE